MGLAEAQASPVAAGESLVSANSDITKPGVQKPHCEPCSSTIRRCTGWSAPSAPRRCSTVSTWQPSSCPTKVMQASTVR
jgi:hypothetical protein